MLISQLIKGPVTKMTEIKKSSGRYTNDISQITKNINKLALPIIAIVALSNLSRADASGLAYGLCVATCTAFATPLLLPACLVGCTATVLIPLP